MVSIDVFMFSVVYVKLGSCLSLSFLASFRLFAVNTYSNRLGNYVSSIQRKKLDG